MILAVVLVLWLATLFVLRSSLKNTEESMDNTDAAIWRLDEWNEGELNRQYKRAHYICNHPDLNGDEKKEWAMQMLDPEPLTDAEHRWCDAAGWGSGWSQ